MSSMRLLAKRRASQAQKYFCLEAKITKNKIKKIEKMLNLDSLNIILKA